jgi:hypothetical protein
MAEDETFETQDSGASEAYPIEAGQIRKGGYIMIKVRRNRWRLPPQHLGLSGQALPMCWVGALSPCLSPAATPVQGFGRVHVQDRQARPRQVPLRRH